MEDDFEEGCQNDNNALENILLKQKMLFAAYLLKLETCHRVPKIDIALEYAEPRVGSRALFRLFKNALFIHWFLTVVTVVTVEPHRLNNNLHSVLDSRQTSCKPCSIERLEFPEFSPMVVTALENNNVETDLPAPLREAATYYHFKYPSLRTTDQYQQIGMMLIKRFPCLAHDGNKPWVSLAVIFVSFLGGSCQLTF